MRPDIHAPDIHSPDTRSANTLTIDALLARIEAIFSAAGMNALQAGAMLPFGGHKGSAISTMIELLAGIMIGDMTSPEVLDYLGSTTLAPRHGELILAFSPEAFARGRPGNPFARAESLFEAIIGQGARLPSQRRFKARAESARDGVTLSDAEIAQLDHFLAKGLAAV